MSKFPFLLLLCISSAVFAQSDTVITLRAITGLQYDLLRFGVKPNQKVTVVFKNDDDMAHNLVFTLPNKRIEVADAAIKMGDKGQAAHYVPVSSSVLAATKIVLPNTTETIRFQAPSQEGVYPYVCTYPGHGYVMYGAMYVTTKPLLSLAQDKNIPPHLQTSTVAHAHHTMGEMTKPSPHPFPLEYPLLYRTFMPDCGPAAIAVALSPTHAYCFDAGKCYLRYAWTGGFVDNTAHWKGNGNALAKIEGQVYWKAANFPFLVKNTASTSSNKQNLSTWQSPKVRFLGYHLIKRLPTFRFMLDDISMTQTIRGLPDEQGIVCTFEFEKPLAHDILFTEFDGVATEKFSFSPKSITENGKYVVKKGIKKFSVTIKK